MWILWRHEVRIGGRRTWLRFINIFVNCNWVDTRWQQYSTHLHKNSTQNNIINLGRVRAVPSLCEFYPGICLTTEEKALENLSHGREKPQSGQRKTSVRVGKTSVREETSVRVEKNLSQGRKNLSQGRENLSQCREKPQTWQEKPQSVQRKALVRVEENLSQGREKPDSGKR